MGVKWFRRALLTSHWAVQVLPRWAARTGVRFSTPPFIRKVKVMNQKERDTQRALGHMKEFRVVVEIPIKVNVRMTQNVEAVNEEDAIEKIKIIHDIIPDTDLLRDALSKAQGHSINSDAAFDTSVDRKYTARQTSSGGPFSSDDCCESAG